ncbi:SMI1/KNR4 family protein [Paenibacillus elgii]|uniref:SMI1/KNR4 family protein n=1 Tax=Paenibacillus elgii TaxID=189691 RepID=UPI001671977C|nr:SMI1/KNR4 family protein [Paenibacillus elgii]
MNNNASLAAAWTSFVGAMNQKAGRFDCYLNGPALPEDIANIERQMGMELPSELKQLYMLSNGQNHQYGVVYALDFLSVEEMYRRVY